MDRCSKYRYYLTSFKEHVLCFNLYYVQYIGTYNSGVRQCLITLAAVTA